MRRDLRARTPRRCPAPSAGPGRASRSDAHLHPPAAGRELDRVRQQVPDDLLQSIGVRRDRFERAVEAAVVTVIRLASAAGRNDSTTASTTACTGVGRMVRASVPATTRDRSSKSSISRDCASSRSFDGLDGAVRLLRIELAAGEQACPAQHGVDRRSQLVGQRRDEFIAESVRRLGLPRLLFGGAEQTRCSNPQPARGCAAAGVTPARR